MPNAALVNFAAGEVSPKSRGRFDAPWFAASCRKLVNFIPDVQGPARFRSGFRFVECTRVNEEARLFPFQVNDSLTFMLEFTEGKMRVFKNGALVTKARTTITAATKANPCVITVASTTGLATGDEIVITGVVGMTELNGRVFRITANGGSDYFLTDAATLANINSTSYGTYSSGGTVREVHQVTSPYLAVDLADIQYAQNNTVGYFVHPRYAPRKLTVDSNDDFTLATYSRTNDPFTTGTALTVTGVTLGTTTTVTFAAGSLINQNALHLFAAVVGTTQLNGNSYLLQVSYSGSTPTAILKDSAGNNIDSSAFTPYVSGGTATPVADCPLTVAFYEGRLCFGGTNQRPNSLFMSRGPNDTASRYDDFTGGIDADHAAFFALAPASGQVDYFAWLKGTAKYLFAGTFGGPFRISGSGLDEAITPSNVNARQVDLVGCEAVMPAGANRLYFIQRGGTAIRTLRYNQDVDDFESYDMTLNAEHIPYSRLVRCVLQSGKPDILWVVREDGVLAGVSVNGSENVAGWHRHKIGGTDAKVIDVAVLPRTDKDDELWVVTERTIGATTRRFIERLADDPTFPDREDFFTDADSADADKELFENVLYRRQEEYIHLDAAATYDGSDRGTAASATLTPSATTGTTVTFTASAAVFASTDVGKELWKKPDRDTGEGSGRAVITAYTDTTHVTAEVIVDFDSTDAIPAGDWYFAAETITGAWHLNGLSVSVVTDGAVGAAATVSNGAVTLSDPAAVVHLGLSYEGLLQTQNLEIGGRQGPAQSKPRNIVELFVRFLNTLGVSYGTDPYALESVEHRPGNAVYDRPSPVFSGLRRLFNPDKWSTLGETEKTVVIKQTLPLPCIVQFLDVRYETADDD